MTVNLTLQNQKQNDGFMHYCYIYMYQGQIIEAPTLRLNPGDQLILNLTDNIQAPYDRYEEARNTPMQQMHDTSPVIMQPGLTTIAADKRSCRDRPTFISTV